MKKFENYHLDENINYKSISGLSLEVIEKLNKIKPATIYEANRISGITPAAVSILLMYCNKNI